MEKGKKEFVTKDNIALKDEDFLKGMETIYNYRRVYWEEIIF